MQRYRRERGAIAGHRRADWSDRRIAEVCGVSNQFVGNIRVEVSTVDTCPTTYTLKDAPAEPETRTGRDGKQYPVAPQESEEPIQIGRAHV